ncbi:MAG: SpoIIE family protein phosphatase [Planctomycetaceae bacterium]|jgi:sigma-B regulation protein RsbU (phosphoserine phosphatase)|nr:SpoIIE family protein phosphatase [Planctomycetaceae bacterium]
MFRSVRSKLLIGILLPLTLIYGIVAVLETRNQVQTTINSTKLLIKHSAERRAARLETEFGKIAAGAELLRIYLTENPDAGTKDIEPLFRGYLEKNPQYVGLFFGYAPDIEKPYRVLYTFRNEKNVIQTQEIKEYDYSRPVYMIPYYTRKDFWAEPYINFSPRPIPICSLALPVFHKDKVQGVVVADIILDKIQEITQADVMEHSQVALISSTGAIITDKHSELKMGESLFSLAEWYGRKEFIDWGHRVLKGEAEITRFEAAKNKLPKDGFWNNKNPIWAVSVPVRQTGWTLLGATDEAEILKPVYAQLYRRVVFFLFGLLLIVGTISVVSFNLTGFLKHLSDFTKELSAGNLYAKVYSKRPNDEFGDIAEAFDRMAVELKSNIDNRMKDTLARKAIEEELRVARQIQTSLLPRTFPAFPHRPEFDLYAKNEPATYIAGDFYDFFFIEENLLVLVIADVSGHGIPAAMFMAVSRTVIRNFSVRGASPKDIIEKTNSVLSKDNDDNMFVTVFLAVYNVVTGELRYVNAGHNPPYIVRKDGSTEMLNPTGPFAAAFEQARYKEAAAFIEPNDVLVSFTDGVTEARQETGNDMLGEARLEALITDAREKSVYGITDTIFKAVDDYDSGQHCDDITVLVLKRCLLPEEMV